MLDEKYLKPPLGEDEKNKKKRLKEEEKRKKQLEEENGEGGGDDGDVTCLNTSVDQAVAINTPLQDWESSLMASTSAAQLFIHLTTLESSIQWSKYVRKIPSIHQLSIDTNMMTNFYYFIYRSLLNAKCRICRKKSDPEKMLLCDGCDLGHHMYCLKPKLKKIPEGEWYCDKCKPKMRVRSPKKNRSRMAFDSDDGEDGGDNSVENGHGSNSDVDDGAASDAAAGNDSDEDEGEAGPDDSDREDSEVIFCAIKATSDC